LAWGSKKGRVGILVCLVSVLFVIILTVAESVLHFRVPILFLMIPGFGSMLGMQLFANQANDFRMQQEKEKEGRQT